MKPQVYFNMLSEVSAYLEKKYNEPVTLPSVGYEHTETIRGENFFAHIYRTHMGRYELTDYSIW